MIKILNTVKEVREFRRVNADKSLALVPTMGNLHDGHLSLIQLAQEKSEIVIASIFVNPTQFAAHEDLGTYPRTFDADLAKLTAAGVDAIFFPDEADIYPFGKDSTLSIHLPSSMTDILCGKNRPGHFEGVATVVAKLFQIVHPDVAIFGKKDFQQLAIIRRLNKELFMNIRTLSGEIIREPSGLAMSSRNQYLNDTERLLAAKLSESLRACQQRLLAGEMVAKVLHEETQKLIELGADVDYLECRDKSTLAACETLDNGVLLIAAKIGKTRLIDNLIIQ